MVPLSRKVLLFALLFAMGGCPKKSTMPEPASPIMPPEEKASDSLPEKPAAATSGKSADPAQELAPTGAQAQVAAPPQEAPASECDKPKDCKVKGKPGKGMRWTCFETRCMAEPKGGLKK